MLRCWHHVRPRGLPAPSPLAAMALCVLMLFRTGLAYATGGDEPAVESGRSEPGVEGATPDVSSPVAAQPAPETEETEARGGTGADEAESIDAPPEASALGLPQQDIMSPPLLNATQPRTSREVKIEAVTRSLLAGLSTSLGAGVVLLLPGPPTPGQMAFALALAGGVMIMVSLVEMWLPQLWRPERWLESVVGAGLGALCFYGLSSLVPEPEYAPDAMDADASGVADHDDSGACASATSHAHSGSSSVSAALRRTRNGVESMAATASVAVIDSPLDLEGGELRSKELHMDLAKRWRLAVVLMLALTAHNFPEGLAVAVSTMESERMGVVVMVAIAMHNIPEGIAIAMPVLDATGSRTRAMVMATLSGFAEPLGAIVAVTLLPPEAVQGRAMDWLLCVVGGIMACVAFIELLPEARKQRQDGAALAGLVTGFAVMLLTHRLA